ncbi:hypothetical protein PYW08_010415 [Mythimna loreyi]|uniref:Uncharacterized protein n=1 Tax=Mythimna loreyi TaxID=667449 RepID=A0ACC2Q4H3_9NEOP|nr:hypothetical protein PYW08_010415 [Mythimna loreyi]
MKSLLFLFTLCTVGKFFSQGSAEPVQSSSCSEEENSQHESGQEEDSLQEISQEENSQPEGSQEESSQQEESQQECSNEEEEIKDSSSKGKKVVELDSEADDEEQESDDEEQEEDSEEQEEDNEEQDEDKEEQEDSEEQGEDKEEQEDSEEQGEDKEEQGKDNEKLDEDNKEEVELNKDKRKKQREKAKRIFLLESAAGDQADLMGQNEHIRQANTYEDFGRRSVLKAEAGNDDYLIPEKAPPELVMLVAKESALMGAGKDEGLGDFDQKKILRSGDYWNGVWKEEVKPKSALRSGTEKKNLGSIKAKIKQGSELYKVVLQMKEISPKLLYIINKKQL